MTDTRAFAFFERAFRPFFLSAAVFSVFAALAWAGYWLGTPIGIPLFDWNWWHGHEMVFGFAVPAVVGFLLTAAQNWTGIATVSGMRLAILYVVWLLPRVLMWFPDVVAVQVVAAIDVAFLPLSAWFLGSALVRAKNWRNGVFVGILLLLAFTNASSYFWADVGQRLLSAQALLGAVFWVLLVVVIMGGRVIPFFTAKRLGLPQRAPIGMVESLSLGLVAVVALIYSLGLHPIIPSVVMALFYGVATVAHAVRLGRWHGERTGTVPLLWSLHSAYGLLVVGLFLMFLVELQVMQNLTTALHFLTIGGIGLLVLAMMSRVSLGHTGRPLQVGRWIPVAYLAIGLSALLRVFGTLILGSEQTLWVYSGSALLWALGFLTFAVKYGPILWQPSQK